MGSSDNHVKQLLATARIHHRPEMLQEVVKELLAVEDKSGMTSTELRVLCSEVAVELQQWPIASQLLRGVGASIETRLLRLRKVFCDVLVSLHEVDTQPSLSEDEKMQKRLMSAATALQTLSDSVETWPDSVETVLIGIRTLWAIVRPFIDVGRQAEVCDVVIFLASLHQQLHIGGGHTLVQWMARSGLCLYAAGRVAEAFAHFSTAMDAAVLLSNQRLYVQLLRLAAGAINAKETAATSSKGRTELLGTYRARPMQYAVLLTQLVFAGLVDVDNCREELHSIYETTHSGNSEVVLPAEAAAAGKGKRKTPSTKQQSQANRGAEAFAIADPEVIEEIKSDLLLCIALYDSLTAAQQEELERKRSSPNRRVRSFIAYALLVQDARQRGLAQLNACADASVLTATHRSDLKAVTQKLLSVLKATNAIHDESERQYTLNVGVSLLWNYILPFLQPAFTGDVQEALDTILEVSQGAAPHLRQLFMQVGLQQCHIAYNEDHRAALHHLLPVLTREYARSPGCTANPHLEFSLQWMQYELTVLNEPESSLTNEEDRCLFAMEQARTVSNPCKRIPLLKTAFQHLPPLSRAEQRSNVVTAEPPAKRQGNAPQQQQQQSSPSPSNVAVPVQRRSTVQLYKELLDLCMEEVSPSLYTVAGTVAEALRTLPRLSVGAAVDDLEEIQAAASLNSATLLWRQLEGEAATSATAPDAPTAFPVRNCMEGQLARLLKEAAQRGASLELRSTGSGGWIVANACVTFLKMKQSAYDAGDYSAHMAELLELHSTYTALFVKGRVQDVALLSDLTAAAVVGLVAGFIAAKATPTASPTAASPVSPIQAVPNGTAQVTTYAELVQRIQRCTLVESFNAQLRKAGVLCREALQLIQSPRHKWFIVILYPTVLRLLNEKPISFLHPQEQVLIHLSVLSGPSLTLPERQTLLEQEIMPRLRRDPSVRLCAWVAALATEMRLEDAVQECYQLADTLYAAGRLGWDSLCDVQGSDTPSAAVVDNSGSGVAPSATMNGANGGNRKGSQSFVLVQREVSNPVKPDAEDWGAYAQLLFMKTQICVNHLQGLCGNVRRIALQQLFTNCVNSVIAATHGPPSSKVSHFRRAFTSYYNTLRSNNTSTLLLADATFILPSLRMLLSKAILTQIPKREWSTTFTELVYQLSTVLIYVSYSSGRDDDVQHLAEHLRLLRELLPLRYQKSLKMRETVEVCYKDPSVEGFLHVSRNMEAELQTHGWLIVAQQASDEGSATEAFALALSGTQTSAVARAQCLFEFAYTAFQQGNAPLSRAVDQLREALRILENLPDSAPFLQDGGAGRNSMNATLVEKSLTALFLKTCRKRSQDEGGKAATLRGGGSQTVPRASIKSVNSTNSPAVSFQHVFLGLRIVALLFRIASPAAPLATGTGSAAVRASKKVSLASRRDCANVMLDYILCLWELCGKLLQEESNRVMASPSSGEESNVISGFVLPKSAAEYYGFMAKAGVAQCVRQLVPDEELQLNTEGMWKALLELGDYLIQSSDEARAFLVYSWLNFAAAMALGEPENNAQCALVQRVCNLKMCVAAAASGLSDVPYVAVLQHLNETHLPLDSCMMAASSPPKAAWLLEFILAECETRVVLGQVKEAAELASKYLVTGCKSSDYASITDVERNGLRILALHDVVCARYDEALHICTEILEDLCVHRDALEPSSDMPVSTWIRLCDVKLRALLAKRAAIEACQWAAAVREQLLDWNAAASATPRLSVSLRTLSLHGELSDAIQYWGKELLCCAANVLPSFTALQLFPSSDGLLHSTAMKLFQEVDMLVQHDDTVSCRLYGAAARWQMRDRVTQSWVAQYAKSTKEHLCPRLMTLWVEIKDLQQLYENLDGVGVELMRTAPAELETATDDGVTAATATTNTKSATSLLLWKALLLHWYAVDRLEANRIVECLLDNFRHLSMEELQLPTSAGPAHLEKEVLKFIRSATEDAPTAADDLSATSRSTPGKVGTRWEHMPTSTGIEIERALQHYGLPVQDLTAAADLSSVRPLIQQALELVRPWSHSSLAKGILITFAEMEMQRLTEHQIAAADDMVGDKLAKQREAILTAAWNRTPLVPPKTDKANIRARKSLSSARQRSSNEASLTVSVPSLFTEEQELLQRMKKEAEEAVRYMLLHTAEQLYDLMSNLAVLLGRPRLAASAAEQLQACQLIGLLYAKSVHAMTDSVEGRLWRQFSIVHPFLHHTTMCSGLLDDVLAVSPMYKYIRSCATLCVEEKEEKVEEVAHSFAHTRDASLVEASPYATDAPVLTIVLSNDHIGCFLVLLRHTDGVVEGRRRSLDEAEWHSLVQQLEGVQKQTSELLIGPKNGVLGSTAQRITSEDAAGAMEPLSSLASQLLMDFLPSLQSFGTKSPLYLCVAPSLQPFAWEQTSVFSACSIVVRELSAAMVVGKYGEHTRTMRRLSAHGTKSTGMGSPKGAPSGPSICIVDAFGDHTESAETVLNPESSKSKNAQHILITCSASGSPPDPAYVVWMLSTSAPSAMVVDMCGNFADALPLSHLAVLRLSQLNVAILADGAVNAESRQREERQQLGGVGGSGAIGNAIVPFVPPRWMVQLLLLLRGARFVVASTFSCTPEISDSLARRCLSSLPSTKTLVDQLKGKTKDIKLPPVTLYGTYAVSTGKQKT